MSYAKAMIGEYGKVNTQTSVEFASPHRLIQMLMEGALEKITIAKGHMQRGNVAEKGRYISWATAIIDGLQMGLDTSVDHEMTRNLSDLYDYMNRRLVFANLRDDTQILDEVASLLKEIKEAWDAIPERLEQAENDA